MKLIDLFDGYVLEPDRILRACLSLLPLLLPSMKVMELEEMRKLQIQVCHHLLLGYLLLFT